PSLGEYQERKVLETRVALLRQNQTGPIHVRTRSSPEGLSAGEWYRRMTFMELNRKLTHLLKGRTIQSESGDEGHVAITFNDESTLKLRVAGPATVRVGAKVEAVHEAGEHFQVDLEEGPSVQVQLADPGSSVALRVKSGAVQYLG